MTEKGFCVTDDQLGIPSSLGNKKRIFFTVGMTRSHSEKTKTKTNVNSGQSIISRKGGGDNLELGKLKKLGLSRAHVPNAPPPPPHPPMPWTN